MGSDYNHITLVGVVTETPYIKVDKDDFRMVRFVVEVERDNGIKDAINVECKGKLGEIVMEFVPIGKKVLLDGSLYLQKLDVEGDIDSWETVVRIENLQILTPRLPKKEKKK